MKGKKERELPWPWCCFTAVKTLSKTGTKTVFLKWDRNKKQSCL